MTTRKAISRNSPKLRTALTLPVSDKRDFSVKAIRIEPSVAEPFAMPRRENVRRGRVTADSSCAGINRHVVGVQVPTGKEVANPS